MLVGGGGIFLNVRRRRKSNFQIDVCSYIYTFFEEFLDVKGDQRANQKRDFVLLDFILHFLLVRFTFPRYEKEMNMFLFVYGRGCCLKVHMK